MLVDPVDAILFFNEPDAIKSKKFKGVMLPKKNTFKHKKLAINDNKLLYGCGDLRSLRTYFSGAKYILDMGSSNLVNQLFEENAVDVPENSK